MNRRRGSVALVLAAAGSALLVLGLLMLCFLGKLELTQQEFYRSVQLRQVAYGAMGELLEDAGDAELEIAENFDFYPGPRQGTLTKIVQNVGNFQIKKVLSEEGTNSFVLESYNFIPTTAVQNRAGSYCLSCYNTPVKTTITNMSGAAYSTKSTFTVPVYDEDKCTVLDLEELYQLGFGQQIYLYDGNLSLPKKNYAGDAMVIVKGKLTIAYGAKFTGRTVFLVTTGSSGSGVEIKGNVEMADVLLLSSGSITLAKGCTITGHLRSNMSITISGTCSFTGRSDAGRPFYAVAKISQ